METHSGLENTQEEGSAGRSKFHALTSWWRHNFFTCLLDYSIINQHKFLEHNGTFFSKVMSTTVRLLLKWNKIISEGRKLSETFNENYVNFVENKSRKKSANVAHVDNIFDNDQGKKKKSHLFFGRSYQTKFVNPPFSIFLVVTKPA